MATNSPTVLAFEWSFSTQFTDEDGFLTPEYQRLLQGFVNNIKDDFLDLEQVAVVRLEVTDIAAPDLTAYEAFPGTMLIAYNEQGQTTYIGAALDTVVTTADAPWIVAGDTDTDGNTTFWLATGGYATLHGGGATEGDWREGRIGNDYVRQVYTGGAWVTAASWRYTDY